MKNFEFYIPNAKLTPYLKYKSGLICPITGLLQTLNIGPNSKTI